MYWHTEEFANHRATEAGAFGYVSLRPCGDLGAKMWFTNQQLWFATSAHVKSCRSVTSLPTNKNMELEIVPFGLGSQNPKELHFEDKVVRSQQQVARPGLAVAGFLWLAKVEPHTF